MPSSVANSPYIYNIHYNFLDFKPCP